MAKLKLAGLVTVRREGRRQVCVIADAHVAETAQRTVGHYAQSRGASRRAGDGPGVPDSRAPDGEEGT
ncbi:hypothetical protein [Actinosynnema sp. ALI-1.44]|uniref:hypothetical protein n=1 Tax=Actinosynnema sp. ALI-1.44 TaxID=1933779 RepID=UPI00187407E6|nr:hypothetical protein [Actinosynnema sp. ALI-1.44]